MPAFATLPCPLVCTVLGLGPGWLPWLVHGPIPMKFNLLYNALVPSVPR